MPWARTQPRRRLTPVDQARRGGQPAAARHQLHRPRQIAPAGLPHGHRGTLAALSTTLSARQGRFNRAPRLSQPSDRLGAVGRGAGRSTSLRSEQPRSLHPLTRSSRSCASHRAAYALAVLTLRPAEIGWLSGRADPDPGTVWRRRPRRFDLAIPANQVRPGGPARECQVAGRRCVSQLAGRNLQILHAFQNQLENAGPVLRAHSFLPGSRGIPTCCSCMAWIYCRRRTVTPISIHVPPIMFRPGRSLFSPA